MYYPDVLSPFLAALLASLAVSVLIVFTCRWHGRLSFDTHTGVQKCHSQPTTRIGGIAVVFGLLAGYALSPEKTQILLRPLLIAGTPAFAIGLLEDLTGRVGIRLRLLTTVGCGVLAWLITGIGIGRLDVPGLDTLLGFTLVSVLLTGVAVGGMANALNIIDGFNGLAAGTVVICLFALASMAASVGDMPLATTALLLAAAGLGFALLNWPWGKLFLGDGGAYFLGFGLAWVAVLMHHRHPDISPWALALVCAYPVIEVLYSVWRRARRNKNPSHPDRLHLHSLVHRRVVRAWFPHASALTQNSITGAFMWLAALLPVGLALQWPGESKLLFLSCLVCGFLYSALHARLTQFHWCIVPSKYKPVVSPS